MLRAFGGYAFSALEGLGGAGAVCRSPCVCTLGSTTALAASRKSSGGSRVLWNIWQGLQRFLQSEAPTRRCLKARHSSLSLLSSTFTSSSSLPSCCDRIETECGTLEVAETGLMYLTCASTPHPSDKSTLAVLGGGDCEAVTASGLGKLTGLPLASKTAGAGLPDLGGGLRGLWRSCVLGGGKIPSSGATNSVFRFCKVFGVKQVLVVRPKCSSEAQMNAGWIGSILMKVEPNPETGLYEKRAFLFNSCVEERTAWFAAGGLTQLEIIGLSLLVLRSVSGTNETGDLDRGGPGLLWLGFCDGCVPSCSRLSLTLVVISGLFKQRGKVRWYLRRLMRQFRGNISQCFYNLVDKG